MFGELIDKVFLFEICRFHNGNRKFKNSFQLFLNTKTDKHSAKVNLALLLCHFGSTKVQRYFHFSLKSLKIIFLYCFVFVVKRLKPN